MKKPKDLSVIPEIKLLRLVVDEIMSNCKKPKDFLLYANILNMLILTIEGLITLEHHLIKGDAKNVK